MNAIAGVTIVYVRVSTNQQSEASQIPELEEWAKQQQGEVVWIIDNFTGKTMKRPGWDKAQALIEGRSVRRIAVWRLDRLGRTAREMTALFEDFRQRRIALVSLREGIDLSTPAGLLVAHVIASVAQYETEIRAERVAAGQAAARKRGVRWGGSKPGRRYRVTVEIEAEVVRMHEQGRRVAAIARLLQLSRPTVYAVLKRRGLQPHGNRKPRRPGKRHR